MRTAHDKIQIYVAQGLIQPGCHAGTDRGAMAAAGARDDTDWEVTARPTGRRTERFELIAQYLKYIVNQVVAGGEAWRDEASSEDDNRSCLAP